MDITIIEQMAHCMVAFSVGGIYVILKNTGVR